MNAHEKSWALPNLSEGGTKIHKGFTYLAAAPKPSFMTFDVTIPVLDEEATLERQIGTLHAFLRKHYPDQRQWQILIADNGSIDATPDLARELEQKYNNVQLVKVPRRGVGLALKTAWSQSQADIVGYMDLDLATDLAHFPETYDRLTQGGCDLVYASRLHPDAKVINRPLKREISSRGFNLILKWYLGVGFSDGMCGFKFLKRQHLDHLLKHGARNDGWFFSTELLTVAEWLHLNICELPVTWTDDAGSSKVNILPLAKRYLQSMRDLRRFGKARGML